MTREAPDLSPGSHHALPPLELTGLGAPVIGLLVDADTRIDRAAILWTIATVRV